MGWLWFCFRLGCDGLPRSDGIAGSDAGGHGSVRSSHVLGIEAHAEVWPVALRALPRQVMSTALGSTFILLLAASAAGLGLGVMASRLLAQIVYEATPRDPVVFVGVMLTMTVLALIATWIPARRAMGIDPAGLLREE